MSRNNNVLPVPIKPFNDEKKQLDQNIQINFYGMKVNLIRVKIGTEEMRWKFPYSMVTLANENANL